MDIKHFIPRFWGSPPHFRKKTTVWFVGISCRAEGTKYSAVLQAEHSSARRKGVVCSPELLAGELFKEIILLFWERLFLCFWSKWK